MTNAKPIRRVAIVGTGVIGASWAAQYLATCGRRDRHRA
jgi:3-hydroxyacyl-CoA dehydrogenase